jgi:uncharacterized protein (DUF885 family)
LFLTTPRAVCEVHRVPVLSSNCARRLLEDAAMDVIVRPLHNLRDMDEVAKWSMLTHAYHEGVPVITGKSLSRRNSRACRNSAK